MAITEILDGFATAMAETRGKLKAITTQIEELTGKRSQILNGTPHVDDIVDAFERGLKYAETSFVQRLGMYISDNNFSDMRAATATDNSAAQLLMVRAQSLTDGRLYPHSALGESQIDIDVAAVTYFLRDQIRAELPSLIAKLCPKATRGMKKAERLRALEEVDAELSSLNAERERLVGEIEAARKVLYANPNSEATA